MTHVVSGKLRKATFIKDGCGPDGMSKMYGIELSEAVKDYKTGEKSYTNYKALFFAKTPNAQAYYDQALAEGSYIVVSCEKLKIEQREHNGQTYITLMMENPRLDGANYPEQGQQQQQQQSAQQNQYQQQRQGMQQQQQPQQQWDSDIPF
ncbi:MAG: hypothetical protein ACRDA8_16265 [Shewanella sp.]